MLGNTARRTAGLSLRRCYSQKPDASSKGITSFLDRMDALYANQSKEKPVATKKVDFKMKRAPQNAAAQRQRPQRQPQKQQQQQRRQQPSFQVKAQGTTQKHAQKPVRAPKPTISLNDDVMDLVSSAPQEKLDIHIQPARKSSPQRAQAARGRPQQRRAVAPNKRTSAGPQRRTGGSKQQRRPKKSSVEETVEETGSISAETALESLRRRIANPTSQYVELDPLRPSHMVHETNPLAATPATRLVSAVQQTVAHQDNVEQIINHALKGSSTDITITPGANNISAISAANTLNAQNTIPHSVKMTIAEIAAGKASISSLKK
ncbi:hypothetical protein TRICI_003054 [Trichomonascus ciferrii]|uniref:Uncharacterized protein n=1 Tax=Trichomonascus ciferrii TaxID=44093 RepID=A0A642V470_9ASCO|nr:hypothetical protein TRICI_003054 [Trichomonascus ciferrii]